MTINELFNLQKLLNKYAKTHDAEVEELVLDVQDKIDYYEEEAGAV